MDTPETPDSPLKEAPGKPGKTIAIWVRLSHQAHGTLMSLTLKKMKQLGEDVPRDAIISEALQFYSKGLNSQD